MTAGIVVAALICGVLFVLQLLSVALASWRLQRSVRFSPGGGRPRICLVMPVCGVDPFADETWRSAFLQDYDDYEIIFCAASPDDAAIPLVDALMKEYPSKRSRLLVGDDRISPNPKLNNISKAWSATDAEWIAIVDSNALMPAGYLHALVDAADADTGLVSSPAIGVRPTGMWGALEAAFLNTLQARWQFLADFAGAAFAQGKTLFWRRATLEAGGGMAALGSDIAEDVASTKLARRMGMKIRLVGAPITQPLGRRRFRDVWMRQLRWTRIRKLGFPGLYLSEILAGAVVPLVALAYLVAVDVLPVAVLPVFLAIWYGAEWAMARINGWPSGLVDVFAMILRDAMLPILYVWSFAGNEIRWRGNAVEQGGMPSAGGNDPVASAHKEFGR